MAGQEGSSQAWHIIDDLNFLTAPANFTLVCSDKEWSGEENPEGRLTAFSVAKEDLARCSGFFRDMFDVADTELKGGKELHCGEAGRSVAFVLSAGLDPEQNLVESSVCWDHLSPALSLAFKWDMPGARQRIDQRLMAIMTVTAGKEILSPSMSLDMIPFFAQAALSGKDALTVVKYILRQRLKDIGSSSWRVGPIKIPPHIYLDLGPVACSKLMQAVLDLTQERVFSIL